MIELLRILDAGGKVNPGTLKLLYEVGFLSAKAMLHKDMYEYYLSLTQKTDSTTEQKVFMVMARFKVSRKTVFRCLKNFQ